MAIFSIIFLVFLLPLTLLFILKQTKPKSDSSKAPDLPPGPTPWPLLGNIHQIGNRPHVSFAQFSDKYGPLISLRLGTQLVVVATSPAVATEILKTNDRQLSSRHVPSAFNSHALHLSLVWAKDCTEHWKSLRNLLRTEVFSSRSLESQTIMREAKVAQMIDYLKSKEGQAVKIADVIFATVFNTLSNIVYSKDFLELEGESEEAVWLKGALNEILGMGGAPNIADYYPILRKFDPQGLQRRNLKLTLEVFSKWEIIINERRSANKLKGSSTKQDFMDRMLAEGFSNDQINLLSIELFTAGTDTTTSTLEWAMSELVKKKEAMEKVKEELRREIGSDSILTESQASQLPYLNACVKETLRLHPPGPFLLPHLANETCQVMNYTIPKGAQVLVNMWAIGRDPSVWEDPLSFKPERFLESNVDYKGSYYEYAPFGTGRRICPGMPSAGKQLPYILGSLIQHFDWVLPGDKDPLKLDMNDRFGETLHKEQPLKLIFKAK